MNIYQCRLVQLLLTIILLLVSFNSLSYTFSASPKWNITGGIAGNCVFNFNETAPLSVVRTLLVDNNLPNGEVLYSWGYADFIPNINGYCNGNGSIGPSGASSSFFASILFPGFVSTKYVPEGSNGYIPTNNPGIGLKMYYTYTQVGVSATSESIITTMLYGTPWPRQTINQEFIYRTNNPDGTALGANMSADTLSNNTKAFSYAVNHYNLSVRAELIKVGIVDYNAIPLNVNAIANVSFGGEGVSGGPVSLNFWGGGGITVIPPTCRLHSPSDYVIDLGRWVSGGSGTLAPDMGFPAYGGIRTIDLTLECSGKSDNVQFRFEDGNSSSLSNHNVSVYDSTGGSKIDGLEIEMSYGGNRIAVDGASKINVGPKGSIKSNAQDFSFNSQDTATFGARFIQTSRIKKSGIDYLGPVTGKVNMYVTYN